MRYDTVDEYGIWRGAVLVVSECIGLDQWMTC